jgi:type III secretion system YscQ/HrcQ family protein
VAIEPIQIADLPPAKAGDVAAVRAAAGALGASPRRLAVEMPPLGSVELRYAGLADGDARAAAGGQVEFGLARGGRVGRICVEAGLARRLVAALLGSFELPALRRLGAGERGLLGGFLAALLDKLGVELTILLASQAPPEGALALAIEVVCGAASGRLVLEVPPDWLRLVEDRARWSERAASLPVLGTLELADTSLAAGELATLAVADTLVFDGVRALPSEAGAPWPARLVVGDYAVAAALLPDGALRVEGPFRAFGAGAGPPGRGEKETTMERSASPVDAAAVLAAAPIEIVAEVGRVILRGEEVLAMAPGTLLSLGGRRASTVSLRVGGEPWAEGELVNIDGELGVRVTALRRPPNAPAR